MDKDAKEFVMPISDKANLDKVIPLAELLVAGMNRGRFSVEDSLCIIDTVICYVAGKSLSTCGDVAKFVLERAKYIDEVRESKAFQTKRDEHGRPIVIGGDDRSNLN